MTGYILHRTADEDVVCGAHPRCIAARGHELAGGLATVRLAKEKPLSREAALAVLDAK